MPNQSTQLSVGAPLRPARAKIVVVLLLGAFLSLMALVTASCATGEGNPFVTIDPATGQAVPGPAARILPAVGATVGGPAGELAGAAILGALNAFTLWQNRKLQRQLNEHIDEKPSKSGAR
jgi:hypothetical protein